jgi:hypothetical protein
VENVNGSGKGDRVRGPIRILVEVLDELHHLARNALSKGASAFRMVSVLGVEQGRAEGILDIFGKAPKIVLAGPDEVERLTFLSTHGVS